LSKVAAAVAVVVGLLVVVGGERLTKEGRSVDEDEF